MVNDIGVDIDSLLQFDKHLVRTQAYSWIGLLFRGFVSRDLHMLRQAYITYIRPLLEHAWSSHLIMHIEYIDSLEQVQRHFKKIIIELPD